MSAAYPVFQTLKPHRLTRVASRRPGASSRQLPLLYFPSPESTPEKLHFPTPNFTFGVSPTSRRLSHHTRIEWLTGHDISPQIAKNACRRTLHLNCLPGKNVPHHYILPSSISHSSPLIMQRSLFSVTSSPYNITCTCSTFVLAPQRFVSIPTDDNSGSSVNQTPQFDA